MQEILEDKKETDYDYIFRFQDVGKVGCKNYFVSIKLKLTGKNVIFIFVYSHTNFGVENKIDAKKDIIFSNLKNSEENDIFIVTKGKQYDYFYDSNFTNIVYQHCFCNVSSVYENNSEERLCVLNNILSKQCSRVLEKIKNQYVEQPELYWLHRIRGCMLELLVIIEKTLYDFMAFQNEQDEFKNILKYVINNLNKNITLTELYQRFFINTKTIEKLFNKYFSTTYKQYVREQRFNLSKNSLEFTSLSIKEIAGKVGYLSTQSFCKFFKEMSGMSPVAYRKTVNCKSHDFRKRFQE